MVTVARSRVHSVHSVTPTTMSVNLTIDGEERMHVEWADGKATGWHARVDSCFICLKPCRYRCCECRSGCFCCVKQWGEIRDTCGACRHGWILRMDKTPVELQGTLDEVWDELQNEYGIVMRNGHVFQQYV